MAFSLLRRKYEQIQQQFKRRNNEYFRCSHAYFICYNNYWNHLCWVAINLKNNYLVELRDMIALAVLPVLLNKCSHLEFHQLTELCYQIADEILKSRAKQESIFNNIKE